MIDVVSGAPKTLTAYEDSVLVVRGEPGVVETKVEGAIAPVEDKGKPAANAPVERRWTIRGDGRATIWRRGRQSRRCRLLVIPAGVPKITMTKDPVGNLSGSLTLAYRIEDRYGVTSARADFAFRAIRRATPREASLSPPRPASRPPPPPPEPARRGRRSISPSTRGPAPR